jgi:uncharacterized protein YeaO (DUF488 family)
MIQIKRVYEPPLPEDGARFLVERLWPRGVKKEALPMAGWLKDAAPSEGLRRWFGHDPLKWEDFQGRYRAELVANPAAWQPLLDSARAGRVTLLFSARDTLHNNALALKEFVEEKLENREQRTENRE